MESLHLFRSLFHLRTFLCFPEQVNKTDLMFIREFVISLISIPNHNTLKILQYFLRHAIPSCVFNGIQYRFWVGESPCVPILTFNSPAGFIGMHMFSFTNGPLDSFIA